jgi:hypothetical protein
MNRVTVFPFLPFSTRVTRGSQQQKRKKKQVRSKRRRNKTLMMFQNEVMRKRINKDEKWK